MAYLSLSAVMSELQQAENEAKRGLITSVLEVDTPQILPQPEEKVKEKPAPQTTTNYEELVQQLRIQK